MRSSRALVPECATPRDGGARLINWRRCWNRQGVYVLTDQQLAESVRTALVALARSVK